MNRAERGREKTDAEVTYYTTGISELAAAFGRSVHANPKLDQPLL
jgi:hypothetical protein